jgi:hypothetical protein
MDSITRTANGSLLQTCQYLAQDFKPPVNSTLNEKFGLNTYPTPLDRNFYKSKVGYLCIGNGGHTIAMSQVVDGTGATVTIAVPKAYKHRGSDAALYRHMPFKAVKLADDAAFVKTNYRLRYVDQGSGIVYYFAKVIDIATISAPAITKRTKSNGVITTVPFVYSSSDLSPDNTTPPGGAATGSNEFLAASSTVQLKLTPSEITDIVDACNSYYGSSDAAVISEVALCAGWDFDNTVTSPSTYVYTEVGECVVTSFLPYFNALQFSTNGIDLTLDIGAAEPMVPTSVTA